MKTIFSILMVMLLSVNLFGQDTAKRKLIVGVYANEKEFLKREPSITKPFKIVPNIDVYFNEETSKNDTTVEGIAYEFLDSTKKHINSFGFCDGLDIYLGNRYFGYSKVDYIGRFSFINTNYEFNGGKGIFLPNPLTSVGLNVIGAALFFSKGKPSLVKRYFILCK